MKYKIAWKSKRTGYHGHGQTIWNYKDACAIVDGANASKLGVDCQHWVENEFGRRVYK